MMNVFLPVFLFGMLVFIHELGHFTIAKLSGVYVERFALGFGPAILRKRFGETEYALCLLPLGGYVKMRGEGDEEDGGPAVTADDPRSFASKPVWTRIAIVAMGPISNLILPIVLFTILFWIGVQTPTSKIGTVVPGYPAAQSGLKPGDRILSIEQTPVTRWSEVTQAFSKRAGIPTVVQLERAGETLSLSVTPIAEEGVNVYGEKQEAGKIGIEPIPYLPVVGVISSNAPAAKAGLRSGDIILSIDQEPVHHWWEFEQRFAKTQGPHVLEVRRVAADESESTLKIALPAGSMKDLGFEEGSQYIRAIQPKSIAEEKGLQPGDKIVALNGTEIRDWYDFRKQIQGSAGASLALTVLRDGKSIDLDVVPKEVSQKDAVTQETQKRRQLGVISAAMAGDPSLETERYANPFRALYRGVEETVDISITTLVGLGKLVTGKLSMNSLGGPISIFYLAGTSYQMGGWEAFFRMMAILSITLAVLNFLPIPVLDGGHLFFFLIEAVKGSPVHLKVQKIGQQIGLAMILSLMALTFYVDVNRFLLEKIRAFFQ